MMAISKEAQMDPEEWVVLGEEALEGQEEWLP
jgi:hypothetical protein